MIQGFLSIRKHADRVMLLVRMMSKSGFPCFKSGERAVKALEKRLQVRAARRDCALAAEFPLARGPPSVPSSPRPKPRRRSPHAPQKRFCTLTSPRGIL